MYPEIPPALEERMHWIRAIASSAGRKMATRDMDIGKTTYPVVTIAGQLHAYTCTLHGSMGNFMISTCEQCCKKGILQ